MVLPDARFAEAQQCSGKDVHVWSVIGYPLFGVLYMYRLRLFP